LEQKSYNKIIHNIHKKTQILTNNEENIRILKRVSKKLEKKIPSKFFSGIDYIFYGSFPHTAVYDNGIIYISNTFLDADMIVENICFKIGEHAYCIRDEEDMRVVKEEFLNKRTKLFYDLEKRGYKFALGDFMSTDSESIYDKIIDKKIEFEDLHEISSYYFDDIDSTRSMKGYFSSVFYHYFFSKKSLYSKHYKKTFNYLKENIKNEERY